MTNLAWPPPKGEFLAAVLARASLIKRDYDRYVRRLKKDPDVKPLIRTIGWREKHAWIRFFDDYTATNKKKKKVNWNFHPVLANNVCKLFETLPLPDAAYGNKTKFELEPWQALILINRYGFTETIDWDGKGCLINVPRFTEIYIEVARGNGKTSFVAGILVIDTIIWKNDGGEWILAATTKDQAGIAYKKIRSILRRYKKEITLKYNMNSKEMIIVEHSNSEIRPVSSDADDQEGLAPNTYVLDELHAHKNRDIYDVLQTAKGKQPYGNQVAITTAGNNPTGVCYEERLNCENLLKGTTQLDHVFAFIATADDTNAWEDENSWKQANPAYDYRPLLKSTILKEYNKAKKSPKAVPAFKQKRVNIWITGAEAWLSVDDWDILAAPKKKMMSFKGQTAYVGIDLSESNDLTAVAICFRDDKTDLEAAPVHVFVRVYAPRESVEDKFRDDPQHPYAQWVKDGHLILTEGNIINWNTIVSDVNHLNQYFNFGCVIFDQLAGSQLVASQFMQRYGEDVVKIMRKTANNISAAAHDFEARIEAAPQRQRRNARQLLTHDANPVMRWMVGNAVVTRRIDGTILPKKPTDTSPLKIDGIDATLHAWAFMMANEQMPMITSWRVFGTTDKKDKKDEANNKTTP